MPSQWTTHWNGNLPDAQVLADVVHVVTAGGGVMAVSAAGLLITANACGWTPGRVGRAAAGSLVMPVTSMLVDGSPSAPLRMLTEGAHVAWDGWAPGGVVGMAVLGVPLAWSVAAWWWARYCHRLATLGHKSPEKTHRITRRIGDARDQAARAAVRYPTPLTLHNRVVLGPCSQVSARRDPGVLGSLLRRRERWLTVPVRAVDEHLVVTGNSGSGKTTLLLRTVASVYAHDWNRYLRSRKRRPLIVFIDCGGDLHTGRRFVQLMTRLGVDPNQIGLWPVTTRLELYDMAAPDMTETLQAMLCPAPATDASQVHFENNRRRVVSLVVGTALSDAGVRLDKPRNRAQLFERLSTKKLLELYAADHAICEEIAALNESKPPAVPDVAGKLRDLFETLGDAFEGGRSVGDFDALYVCTPGTTRKETARAQVSAIKTMVLQFAATGHDRRIRIVMDEKSAVADDKGDVDVIDLVERARKLNCSLIYAAQSFLGLARTEEECHRIVDSTSGGWIGMRGENNGVLCEKFGTRTVFESTRHLTGSRLGEDGTVNSSEAMLVHPNRLRRFEVGQAVYVSGGHAVWGQVAPIDLDELPTLEYPQWARIDTTENQGASDTADQTGPQRNRSPRDRPIARRADIDRPQRPKPPTKKRNDPDENEEQQ
ncbi:hypothetical protein [Nocardia transvalensis]|uniref:hypothetical protein n=1 Tax=Nocardia transvalensis TaxID=37333 RepID=UPI00189567E0|nr:hypothetical protein [Nocardia transvalensis]MBF6329783.1 hypothetical protein [Nocardia transvalensis]